MNTPSVLTGLLGSLLEEDFFDQYYERAPVRTDGKAPVAWNIEDFDRLIWSGSSF